LRALLSVYDKTGVVELAQGLAELGWDLVSSGGTAKALSGADLAVTDVADLTGYPPILGHRVVTLHPKVHGGLLADPTNDEHRADMDAHGIEPIELVVSNLYPFGSAVEDFEHGGTGPVDVIDIGGPALVRAAAKNHAHVGVVVDPADYEPVLSELRANGSLGDETRRRLALKAFTTTSAYDAAVVNWLREVDASAAVETGESSTPAGDRFPASFTVSLTKAPLALRYGENPHQAAALYRTEGASPWWAAMSQHAGLALSYLNLFDADAAWLAVHDLGRPWEGSSADRPTCVIVKHANPCGVAVADDLVTAYQRAFDCDSRSAFGGIVALNRPIDEATVAAMEAAAQADVVIAPGYGEGVIDRLVAKRKNTRLLEAPPPEPDPVHLRPVTGGMLVQEPHRFLADPSGWEVVTERKPTEAERADAALAFRICGWVKSNSIVLVRDGAAWGIGAGQQSRVEAGQIAAAKAAGRAAGGASASDAFYPFPDGIEAAAEAGVAVIVQPGGSVRDDQCIAKANELGLSMLFTGERHFLH